MGDAQVASTGGSIEVASTGGSIDRVQGVQSIEYRGFNRSSTGGSIDRERGFDWHGNFLRNTKVVATTFEMNPQRNHF
jgi:hypothetical protein